ncbi:MAG: hypothetical protein EA383_06105 [Spirochaetaceae bacterium]|nr:MAG: hypothetical protein EA383_06105 [Spirochaetaceae bacterium]
MQNTVQRRFDWTAILSLAVLSGLVYYSRSFYLLFPAPLQFLYGKTDTRHFLIGCGAALLIIFGIVVHRASEVPADLRMVAFLEALTPAGLMAGLLVLNFGSRGRRTAMLFGAGAIVGVAALPSVLAFTRSDLFSLIVEQQVAVVEQALGAMTGDASVEQMIPGGAEQFFRAVWLRVFAAGLTVMLGLNWMVGRRFAVGPRAVSLDRYWTPHWLPFVAATALLFAVIDATFTAVLFGVIGWNALGIAVAVFAVQGFSLLQHVVGKGGKKPVARAMLPLVLMLVLFVPFLSGFVLVGLPALGLVEHWKQRRRRPSS